MFIAIGHVSNTNVESSFKKTKITSFNSPTHCFQVTNIKESIITLTNHEYKIKTYIPIFRREWEVAYQHKPQKLEDLDNEEGNIAFAGCLHTLWTVLMQKLIRARRTFSRVKMILSQHFSLQRPRWAFKCFDNGSSFLQIRRRSSGMKT